MKKWLIFGLVGFIVIVTKVCFFSVMKASVTFSESNSCEIRTNGLYHWFTDRRIPLTYWKSGHAAGRVDFRFSPNWFRTAIFPTEDKKGVFCFYQTDLTIALFAIELEKTSDRHSAPDGFFTSSPQIVAYTDFALRRCSREDVDYLTRYIRGADDDSLRRSFVSGLPFPYDSSSPKPFLLEMIEHVTTPTLKPLAGEIPEISEGPK